MTDIQRAARFYYLQHHAFGAKRYGQYFGTATTGKAPNLLRIEESLSEAYIRMAGTYIENLSWTDCFKRYDRPHTFFYADPPYWKMAGYNVEFGIDQYQLLAELMQSAQGKVMVSLNDHEEMREIFKDFKIKTLNIKYSVGFPDKSRSKSSSEMVIMNY